MAASGTVILTPSILGPNPGLSIIRIWQGVVEVCLRLAIAILSLSVVLFAGLAVASESSGDGKIKSAGLLAVAVSCVAAVVEVLVVVLRFLNIGFINLNMKKFFICVLCFVCAVLAVVLAVWSVLFIVRRWYYKLLQYLSLP